MKLSTRPSSLRPYSACSPDKVQEVPAVPTLNTLAWVLARQSWIVTENHTDNIVEAAHVIRLPATEFSLLPLLLLKPVSIIAEALP